MKPRQPRGQKPSKRSGPKAGGGGEEEVEPGPELELESQWLRPKQELVSGAVVKMTKTK